MSKHAGRGYIPLPFDSNRLRAIDMTTKTLGAAPLARCISILALLAAGCAAPPPGEAPPPAREPAPPPPPAAAAPAAPPPLVAAPFADAVARAGERLIQDAQATLGNGPRDLVIDPLIDASTGQQTNGTVQMGVQLAGLITRRVPTWNVQPLTRGALATRPLLLIGTLTAINTKNASENADAFRVCLVLIDLRTGKLVAKRVDRATPTTVDAEPLALYRESPTWALDSTALAYIKSCQGSSPGDPVAPGYLQRLPAQAVINEAMIAYTDNKPADAYRLYREAHTLAGPDDLRVLNGLYTTSWKTGRKKEAAETFGKIVGLGLDAKKLPIKLFFNPGTTTLLQTADLQAQYAVWLHEVATQMGTREGCLRVVGHTSRTGDATANEVLSQKRAAAIKASLERQNKKLAPKITTDGVGSREVIVGLGTDDLRDALDRRVEFRSVDCR